MNDFYLIAKIDSAFGKNGFVKVTSVSDFPERFFGLSKVYIDFFEEKKEFFVEDVKETKGSFIFKFKNFDSDDDVRILIDKEIYVDEENVIKLPENHYFIHDLIGSKVLRNNEKIGTVKDVLSSSANDIYIVENAEGKEILIPAVKEFVESFDEKSKTLILKSGENLYDDED